ncbi:hypothetical protein D9M68_717050 [compost metagenome]
MSPTTSARQRIGSITAAACFGVLANASSGTAIPPRAPPKPPLESPVRNTAGRANRRKSDRLIRQTTAQRLAG